MFTTITKIHLFQTIVCILLSVLSITILPSIQNLLIKKRKAKSDSKDISFFSLLFSSEDFKKFKDKTVCPGELLIVMMFVIVLLEYSFVKVTYSAAFVCFIISLELIFFVNWPVKLTITGFNEIPLSVRYGDFQNRERYKINLMRYIRLLIFIPICDAFILLTSIDSSNSTHLIVTVCVYFVFNYIINWMASKYIFISSDKTMLNSSETCIFSKDVFGITKDSLKIILFILIVAALFLKFINLL